MLKLRTGLASLVLLGLAACEDAGNSGDDNILTGATGVILLVIVVLVVAFFFFRNRR